MGEEGKREHEGDDCGVVNLEVGEILTDPGKGIGEGVGSCEGAPIDELHPWTALREAVAERGGEA